MDETLGGPFDGVSGCDIPAPGVCGVCGIYKFRINEEKYIDLVKMGFSHMGGCNGMSEI